MQSPRKVFGCAPHVAFHRSRRRARRCSPNHQQHTNLDSAPLPLGALAYCVTLMHSRPCSGAGAATQTDLIPAHISTRTMLFVTIVASRQSSGAIRQVDTASHESGAPIMPR
ncbi:hypothetical protein PAXRUDRAFT_683898 [Paxillus rubicundulus Ve08.2h10]|uniref:Uncharacterized protein n=1 Tax=Paxillus rubicundulus Ve08.2h10 TaxID=930991 RepID=A0A0D0DNU9_9AGAM|nr:hypothetical protein PAXRUDRAFT_683898 [Paxillus rubicundulus Ve08.2h10]